MTASDTKNIQVIDTSIVGTSYLNQYPGETILLRATTTNVIRSDHDVVAVLYQGSGSEKYILLDQNGTNSWESNYTIPSDAAIGTYTIRYQVLYCGTGETLSYNDKQLGIISPPSVDMQYRVKKPAGYAVVPDTRLFAYFGNKGAETVNVAEQIITASLPIALRDWTDNQGHSGTSSSFENTYTNEGSVKTSLRVKDSISVTKSIDRQWSNTAEKSISIKEVAITPTTDVRDIIPEKLFAITADVSAGTIAGAANPDLSVTATVMQKVNGVSSSLSGALPMTYAASKYAVNYAFNAVDPTDTIHQYWVEYDVRSPRSSTWLAHEEQQVPVVLPQIVGNSYETIPFKTIQLKAETVLADPALHWVRVRIPDADISFTSTTGDMVYDPSTSTWSMDYTVPIVDATKSYPLLYELVSKSTGMVVVSDTQSLTIKPPTAVASNPAEVEVYDLAPLTVKTTNATPDDYRVTATVFNKTVDLTYDASTETWSFGLAIPKDYSFMQNVVYHVIAKARPDAALITINKPLNIRTWLRNVIIYDKETGEQVTSLIPKRTYRYEIDSSINVSLTQIFSLLQNMENKIFELPYMNIDIVKTTEDTTDPANRHKTWVFESTFEHDYAGDVSSGYVSSNSVPFKGTTYDAKTLSLNAPHNVGMDVTIDFSVPAQAGIGYGFDFSSSADKTTGPIITSNVPLQKAEVYFNNGLIGTLTLHTPAYSAITKRYTYETDVFSYTIPAATAEGTYPVAIKATAINLAYAVSTKSIEVLLNRPPVSAFTWAPQPTYEGDVITLTNKSTDPDGDSMTYLWTITGPGSYHATFTTTDVVLPRAVTEGKPGSYAVTLRATDSKGMTNLADATGTITVLPLTIAGTVTHTDKWEYNRKQYNMLKSGTESAPWLPSVFLAGEEFVLNGQTANILSGSSDYATQVLVTLVSTGTTVSLAPNAAHTLWSGTMWQDDFIHLTAGLQTFRFQVTYSNGVVKSTNVDVTIDANTVNDYYSLIRMK